ncbi:glycosyltransferase [Patescibacteria group bacterium]|nr:glycosyltransferase [Patescibacteria group bacterium]
MKYSIVIPTLNEEKYVGILLESLKKQSFKDFEVLVIEGNSKDKTKEVVSQFCGQIENLKLIDSPKTGAAFQRNYGAEKAKSDNLMFMDADIKLDPDFLQKIDKYLKTNDVDVLTVKNIPISNKLVDKFIYWLFCDVYLPIFSKISPVAIGTFIYIKREALEAVGGFPEDIFLGEDFNLVRSVHKKGYKKFRIIKDPPIYFSVRRLNEQGRFKFVMNNVRGSYYYFFKGGIKRKYADKFDFETGKHK